MLNNEESKKKGRKANSKNAISTGVAFLLFLEFEVLDIIVFSNSWGLDIKIQWHSITY